MLTAMRTRALVFCALGYFAIGIASAVVSNPVEAAGLQAALRLFALLLGALVFANHIRFEITRLGCSVRGAAAWSSVAVALGTFALAVYTVFYNVLVRSNPASSIALVLVLWPLVTGVLSFVAALVLGRLVIWRQKS